MPARRENGRAYTPPVTRSKKKVPAYVLPKGPRGDAPQTRKADAQKADAFKKTAPYRGAVRAAYKSNTEPERQQAVARARTTPTREGKAILHTHNAELHRNSVLKAGRAGFTGMDDVEARKAENFKRTNFVYQDDLRRTAEENGHGAKPEHHSALSSLLPTPANLQRRAEQSTVAPDPSLKLFGPALAATERHPLKVGTATLHSVPGIAKGTVGGLAQIVTHPKSLAKLPGQLKDDYTRRYGGDFESQVKRIEKEGVAPELMDATALFGGGGAVAGRAAGRLAERGVLGSTAKGLMTEARPGLRVRAGDGGVLRQEASKNISTRQVQKLRDERRAKVYEKRKAAGIHTLAPEGPDEVVQTRLGRITGGQKAGEKRGVADRLGRGYLRTKVAHAREIGNGVLKERRAAKKDLSKPERDAFDALEPFALRGLVDYKAGNLHVLGKYEDMVKKARGEEPPKFLIDNADSLKAIEKIREHHGDAQIDNGKVAAALETYHRQQLDRHVRLESRSKVRAPEQAEARRHAPEARLNDPKYHADLADNETMVTRSKQEKRDLEHDARKLEGAVQRKKLTAARSQGQADVRVAIADKRALRGDKEFVAAEKVQRASQENLRAAKTKAKNLDGNPKATHEERAAAHREVADLTHEHGQNLKAYRAAAASAEDRAMGLVTKVAKGEHHGDSAEFVKSQRRSRKDPLRGLHRKPQGAIQKLHGDLTDVVVLEKRLADVKQAIKDHRLPDERDVRLHRQEIDRQMVARAKERLGDRPAPVYVQDRPFSTRGFGDYAPGGTRAMAGDRQNRGRLFERGLMDVTPGAYEHGMARSLKREHQWDTYTDLIEGNAIRDPKTGTRFFDSKDDAERTIQAGDMDPDGLRLVNVTRFRESAMTRIGRAEREGQATEAEVADHGDFKKDLAGATVDPTPRSEWGQQPTIDMKGEASTFHAGDHWAILTKNAHDEMMAQAAPSGAALRITQKAQGLTSRSILNTNPLYVVQNTLSNLIATAASTRPDRFLSGTGNRWYSNLDAESRAVIDEWAGIHTSAFDASQSPRMGAAGSPGMQHLADVYHTFVDSDIAMKAKKGHVNVFTWNHKLDERQNNIFRREVFYDTLKRKARDNIQIETNGVIRDMGGLMDILKMPDGHPDKLAALRAAEPEMERMAKRVDSILGNWTSFTAMERKGLKTAFLFYGFLRYATKLTFYTLPIKHPVVTAMIGKLGQLHNEEIVDILGEQFAQQYGDQAKKFTREQIEDAIRSEMLNQVGARAFWQGSDGELHSVDAAKINPFVGPAMDFLDSPTKTFFGLMSPILQTQFNYMLGEDPGYHVPVNLSGRMTAYKAEPKKSVQNYLGYNVRQFGMLSPAIRAADAAATPKGVKQADDSLPIVGSDPIKPISDAEKFQVKRGERDQPGASKLPFGVRAPAPVMRALGTTALSPLKNTNDVVTQRLGATVTRQQTEKLTAAQEKLVLTGKDKAPVAGSPNSREYDRLGERLKILKAANDVIQGRPPTTRRSHLPKTVREEVQAAVDKVRKGDPAADIRKKIQKIKERQAQLRYAEENPR